MDMACSHPMAASFSSIMLTLYDALLGQHARQLKPVRCARSTIAQLHRYFEDVVLENNLNALVVENLPTVGKQLNREKARVRELARGHRRAFFLISEAQGFKDVVGPVSAAEFPPVILQHTGGHHADEHFVLIADSRFPALLATVRGRAGIDTGDDVIWTFEPDIVYSALEFMMSRMAAEHPYHSATFEAAVRESMPKATSLQLTLSVTTKLAHLLQEQAGRAERARTLSNFSIASAKELNWDQAIAQLREAIQVCGACSALPSAEARCAPSCPGGWPSSRCSAPSSRTSPRSSANPFPARTSTIISTSV